MSRLRTLALSFAAAAFTMVLPAQSQGIQLTTGVDGGVIYAYDPLFLPPTGLTVEAWIQFNDTIPTGLYYWPTIARQNVTPNQESWNFRVSSGNTNNRALQFIVRTQTNALYSATYNFAAGEFLNFTHVAGTFDGTNIRIYKNAVQVATYTIPTLSEVVNNGGELRVGNGDPVAPGRETWNGVIDELRIWPMARSAAELAATMNQQLWFMPGGVLEFDYDGSYTEFSHNLPGTTFGTVGFAAGNPSLALSAPTAAVTGLPTSTCQRTSEIVLGSLPQLGNSAFTIWCVRGPRPANSPLGVVVAAVAQAPIGQPPVVGVNLAFNLTSVIATQALVPPTNPLGNAQFNLPVPNNPGLVGVTMLFQYGFSDAQCGPQGFSASNGLSITFQQ